MSTIEEELKRLPDLYDITGVDWEITISHTLTEPTMPTVSLFETYDEQEGGESCRYFIRFDCPTVLEGVMAAVDHVIENVGEIKRLCPKERQQQGS